MPQFGIKKRRRARSKLTQRRGRPRQETKAAKFAIRKPEFCLACNRVRVTYPSVVCRECVDTDAGRKAMRRYRKARWSGGSVRAVSGGLPSLGKRR
jgi:hypothetical protein